MTNEEKKAYMKKWRSENREKINLNNKLWRNKNHKIILIKEKNKRELNKNKISEKTKEYFNINKLAKEKKLIRDRNYAKNNRCKINEYRKNKKETDNLYKITCNIRALINNSFRRKNFSKNGKTKTILGCSFDEFKLHLESKFEAWMTWDNRGLYNGELNYGWDIDHITPLDSAITEEDVIRLSHYTNLQPLCSKVNRDIKRSNIIY